MWEAVDVRLVGDACLWAAQSPNAVNETFNLTNGEVFSFRDMWPALADCLGVEIGPDAPLHIGDYLAGQASAWRELARQHNLREPDLARFLGESHHYAAMCFNTGQTTAPPPTFVSTIKIKQAGFTATMHTEESFCYWLETLKQERLLPTW